MIEIAIGAGATMVVAIGMFVLGLRAADAEKRCADARTDGANLAGQLAIAAADIATHKAATVSERMRADALDKLCDEITMAAAGDVAGAHARVLRRWALLGAAGHSDAPDRSSTPAVSVPPAPDPAGPDSLERP